MTGWILRIILVILIVRAIVRFVRGLLEGARVPSRSGPREADAVPLVKDPVCGTYVVRARALTSGAGSDLHYFCSEQCRETYMRTAKAGPSTAGARPAERREGAGRRTA
jgi:YHS domain-containing protein